MKRKFLVSRLPDALERLPCTRMEQVYVSTDPLIMVSRAGERYILTCKGREEFELDLTPECYTRLLLAKANGTLVVKDRYCVPLGAHTVELDIFQEPLAPLVLAAVELSTGDAAPDWFGREVTHDPAYTNAALSQNGLPDSFQAKYDPKDLRSVLLYVRQKFDVGAFEQASRIFSILLDFAPDLKGEANVLRQMSDAGLLREFRKASESRDNAECTRITAKSRDWLSTYLMLSHKKADYFITALQATYGMEAKPPKPVPQSKSAPTPAPPPPKPTIIDSGRTGDCKWTLDSNGVFTVSGQGWMGTYDRKTRPWIKYKKRIQVVVIARGVTSIGEKAFSDCSALTSVTISESVNFIANHAFYDCAALKSVTIADGVTAIGYCAFNHCTALTNVTIPKSVKTIESNAFDHHTQIIRR